MEAQARARKLPRQDLARPVAVPHRAGLPLRASGQSALLKRSRFTPENLPETSLAETKAGRTRMREIKRRTKPCCHGIEARFTSQRTAAFAPGVFDFDCISHRKGFRPSIQKAGAETSCG